MDTALSEQRIIAQLADELSVRIAQIVAAVGLMDEGATVPFIARYRKEVTGGLDDTQLRTLQDRLIYLRELEERRAAILESIDSQGKLTPELRSQIELADTKQRLEDLYLPYKQKRRTRAQIAREAGLGPLADALLTDPAIIPQDAALAYINIEAGIKDLKTALDGARDIISEQFAENADLLNSLRTTLWDQGIVIARMVEGKEQEGSKFRDYFEHHEPIKGVPSHRALAMLRGREQGFLTLKLDLPERLDADTRSAHPFEAEVARLSNLRLTGSPRDMFLADACRWTWRVKLASTLETELVTRLREAAESEAITVFGNNLKDLLLAAPAGQRCTMGLDPGIRTGVKVAVVDGTGQLVATHTVYPHEPRNDWDGSMHTLAVLCKKHSVDLVSIGNGTASRETDKLVQDMIKRFPELKLNKLVVSEAGASVYSASELAAKEFPDLDVSIRGAVSIARRLQDPLAELVKIDAKSIGVGQYQHDVDQRQLAHSLEAVVEDCVNAVGVEVNTASEPLLARVSGLNTTVAKAIVEYRNKNGAFRSREQLRQVPRLGDKTFEQAAGFLRIHAADNPLDKSAVHPEAYPLVQKMLAALNKPITEVIGKPEVIRQINPSQFTDDKFGLPTVKDILAELEKPGRDPRPEFKTATFDDTVQSMSDLKPGQLLEGVVTNVANFGAFVDIGVHQDGLVHISALSTKFVKDPREVVKVGDVVKVKVLEVDAPRKRIALTMRLSDEVHSSGKPSEGRPLDSRSANDRGSHDRSGQQRPRPGQDRPRAAQSAPPANNAFAAAFAKAKGK